MANEVTVPLLPCGSIDDIADFYQALGFEVTYRQTKPNPYVAVRREDLHLHFFGMPDFDAATSYGTCLVLSQDVAGLHAAFAAGLRARFGKVPVAGLPRMTRPRPRKNMDGVTGFSLVDPGGNWIRVTAAPSAQSAPARSAELPPARSAELPPARSAQSDPARLAEPPPARAAVGDRLAVALDNAVVQGDGRGEPGQAAKILDGALRRGSEDPVTLVRALVYRAELAEGLGEPAAELLERAHAVVLTPAEQLTLAAELGEY
ncbi:hypothetical protein GCM10010435_18500 [Winogradskya consettensis]|uniref:VOC family protein n=1 Tax=Winogradskya consettensis TaxID=113560 RepID=A0A919SWN2_9ACTN|nr:VOC family protein [Actinoplanes consettensis]GIM78458.1 hypothetical protein Aco04nite_60550 [Actinoplanes consettensis]